MEAILDFIPDNKALLWWLGVSSIVMFFGTLVLVPILVVKIPEDYFVQPERQIGRWEHYPPAWRWTLLILKNLAGIVFVLAGIAMSVGPGQGAITILLGITLLDFPGKFRLERWIIRKRPIHRTINWIRAKANRPPLKVPEKAGTADERG